MEGYISKDKWVDLSGLPRLNGSSRRINWRQSVGYVVPFCYAGISSFIKVVGYKKTISTIYLYITVDKFVDCPRKITTAVLTACYLEHIIGNRIIVKAPEVVQYLRRKDDAYRYSATSHDYIDTCCPVCEKIVPIRADHLTTYGFHCSVCGDGISYPNKFMFNLLSQLNIDFLSEVSKKNNGFQWAEKYRYDFYFDIDNKKILVEVDGGFHIFNQQKINDEKKTRLACSNGYNLIRIDCNYNNNNRFLFIKNSIINSPLNTLLDLTHIDWDECNKFATNNLTEKVCHLWEYSHKSVEEISAICQLHKTTVCKYLKNGFLIGLCPSYNKEESKVRSRYKPIAHINGDEIINVFCHAQEVSDMSLRCFGKFIARSSVHSVCTKHRKSVFGLKFKYITKEEYEQYKMINNNEVVLKEVI